MSLHSCLGPGLHFRTRCRAFVSLLVLAALAWSSPIFGDEIHDAAKNGDLGKVRLLLKRKPALVFSKDEYGYTPLHWAAQQIHKDVVALLLASGADANARTTHGLTPLHLVVGWHYTGRADIVRLLLANRADVNAKDNAGHTPLHMVASELSDFDSDAVEVLIQHGGHEFDCEICDAAAGGDFVKVKALLEGKPDLALSKDDSGNTPLHWAAFAGRQDVAAVLLINHADVNAGSKDGLTPLAMAANRGHKDVAELLLTNKADVNAKGEAGWTPLHMAVINGHEDVAALLLASGADVNAKSYHDEMTPLHWAALNGDKHMAALLLANGADVNAYRDTAQTPLQLAEDRGKSAVAELLRQQGGSTPMQPERARAGLALACGTDAATVNGDFGDAARAGDLTKVKPLLKRNPDLVFSKDRRGWTPLHFAAACGQREVTEFLLANKADVNAKEILGYTPLHIAASLGHKEVVRLLLANGADVNALDKAGDTALHDAASGGYRDITELLLANKANVNSKGFHDSTPLFYAAALGRKDIAELLLASGADANARTTQGLTPLQIAVMYNLKDIVMLLRQHGGRE